MIFIAYVALAVSSFCVYMWHYKGGDPFFGAVAVSLIPSAIAGAVAILPAIIIGEFTADKVDRTFYMDESSEGWITYDESDDGYNDPAIYYYQAQANGQLKQYWVKEDDAKVETTTGKPELVRVCKDYTTVPEFFNIPFGDDINCSDADSTFYIPEEN